MFKQIKKAIEALKGEDQKLWDRIIDLEVWKKRGDLEKQYVNKGFTLYSTSYPPNKVPVLCLGIQWYKGTSNYTLKEFFFQDYTSVIFSGNEYAPFAWREVCQHKSNIVEKGGKK